MTSADLFSRHYQPGGIARSLASQRQDDRLRDIIHKIDTDTFVTKPASRGPKTVFQKYRAPVQSRFHERYGHDEALLARMQRRRNYGSSNPLPPSMRFLYRPSEHAALSVVAWVCKKKGACFMSNESIADAAGVSVTTVKNAIREAKKLGHLCVVNRPRPGAKNLTNIITVISSEWLSWMKRSIGVKGVATYKTTREQKGTKGQNGTVARAYERERAATEASKANEQAVDAVVIMRKRAMTDRLHAEAGIPPVLRRRTGGWS